jgi:hypothetical protein
MIIIPPQQHSVSWDPDYILGCIRLCGHPCDRRLAVKRHAVYGQLCGWAGVGHWQRRQRSEALELR